MAFKAVAQHAPVVLAFQFQAAPADGILWVADRHYELVDVWESHSATASSATLMLEKAVPGTAPAAGVDLLGTAFAADSTANTPVRKRAGVGTELTGGRFFNPGDALVLDVTGTLTAYRGALTVVFRPLPARD